MLRDLGSRDTEFKGATKYVRDELLKVAQVDNENWTCVPMQGSGSFAVEAVLQTAIPRQNGKVFENFFQPTLLSPFKSGGAVVSGDLIKG